MMSRTYLIAAIRFPQVFPRPLQRRGAKCAAPSISTPQTSFCFIQLHHPCASPAVARIPHHSSQVMIMRGGGKKNLESFYPTSSGNQTQTVKVSCCSPRLSSLRWGVPWHAPSTLKKKTFLSLASRALALTPSLSSGRVCLPQTHEHLPRSH